jgi:hypothetical protein
LPILSWFYCPKIWSTVQTFVALYYAVFSNLQSCCFSSIKIFFLAPCCHMCWVFVVLLMWEIRFSTLTKWHVKLYFYIFYSWQV